MFVLLIVTEMNGAITATLGGASEDRKKLEQRLADQMKNRLVSTDICKNDSQARDLMNLVSDNSHTGKKYYPDKTQDKCIQYDPSDMSFVENENIQVTYVFNILQTDVI